MMRRQGFQYRLVPTPEQRAVMERTAGTVRFIWNSALALQKERLRRHARVLNYAQLCKELTAARQTQELEFLAEVHSKPQQQVLKDLARAFADFFLRSKGVPRFKKKGRHDAFRHPERICVTGRHVSIPGIGAVRFRKSRDVVGTIKNATLFKRGGRWYVSVQTEREVMEAIHPSTSEVGIDCGIARFATLSNGEKLLPLNSFRSHEQQLATQQKILSRKKKFSSNWKKQRAKVSRLHVRIADVRKDFLHKASTDISKNHAVICLEDLKVSNLSVSAKGTHEAPGRRVAAKRGLNKSILDQGWYEFRGQLEYKQCWRGGLTIAVPAQYTSQRCSACGHTDAANRPTQEQFLCVACGHAANADENAAMNVLRAGQAQMACGSNPIGGRNQEPGLEREFRAPLAA